MKTAAAQMHMHINGDMDYFLIFSNDPRVKMLIYNFQMGGNMERGGPGGNKNMINKHDQMINIPIKIEAHQDNNQQNGHSNKVTFSEQIEASLVFISFLINW